MTNLFDFLHDDYKQIEIFNKDQLKNKTIFITGSNGLIGSNLLSYIVFLNREFDLNIKIIAHSFSKQNEWLIGEDYITYLSGNLNDLAIDFKFDYLIHTATYGQPRKVLENLEDTLYLNTSTYYKLLNTSLKNGARVLFLSTSSIYGNISGENNSINENFVGKVSLDSISSLYGESKRIGEIISRIYIEQGLDVKIARIAIGYGPGIKLNDKRFMGEFIKKALDLGKIEMLDQGEAIRQVCYITDVVEMLMNILLNAKDVVYNVSGMFYDGYGFRIRDIAEIIAKYTNASVVFPKENNGVLGSFTKMNIDISKYTNEFKKSKFVDIDYGLSQTIKWFQALK
ncbi:NAD-dependent epimerase/dehydratase family protein [Campylobacter upsaliensis]|uniref:NAD-dependent epimerase/dehydratase family protein n=1 Tax=Campylobacter upsaliensis TaxID=28080 RepID=UPI0022EB3165|nr:NAD(P)-dependent oxidoreductase [Campylobacter upsaliensis]